jgi:predicted Zn-dependent protease
VEKTAPAISHPMTEQKVTSDVAEVEASKEAEQPKIEEPQQMKNESQAPAKANKRGLKVKTYSPESDKK